jgi:hypothetical protein
LVKAYQKVVIFLETYHFLLNTWLLLAVAEVATALQEAVAVEDIKLAS